MRDNFTVLPAFLQLLLHPVLLYSSDPAVEDLMAEVGDELPSLKPLSLSLSGVPGSAGGGSEESWSGQPALLGPLCWLEEGLGGREEGESAGESFQTQEADPAALLFR